MENALKGLMMAAGITITCMVIGLGFVMAREAKQTAVETSRQMSEFRRRLYESNYTAYDGAVISGAELQNFLQYQFSQLAMGHTIPEFFEIVDGSTYHITNSDEFESVVIQPYNTYKGAIVRGHGNEIIGLIFTKNN